MTLLEHAYGLHQDLRVLQQIGANLDAEGLSLFFGHILEPLRGEGLGQERTKRGGWEFNLYLPKVSAVLSRSCARLHGPEPCGRSPLARVACRAASRSLPVSAYRSAVTRLAMPF